MNKNEMDGACTTYVGGRVACTGLVGKEITWKIEV